jgi:hypothetical protein
LNISNIIKVQSIEKKVNEEGIEIENVREEVNEKSTKRYHSQSLELLEQDPTILLLLYNNTSAC